MKKLLKTYGPLFFLGILLLLGFIIRAEGLFSNHVLFLYDSARDFLYTKSIVVDHRLYLIGPSSGGLQGYFHGVLWYYLLTIPFLLSHGNPLSGTIFMIVGSLSSVVLTFFLIRKISNTYTGLLAATFFAVTSFSVATARFIWNPYPIVWLMPLYFYFTYQYFNKKRGFIWIALLSGLFIHFEAVYGTPLLLPLLILTFLELRKKQFKNIFLGAVVFMLPMVPSVVFDLRHNFLISGSILQTIISGGGNITHDSSATPMITRFILRSNDLFTYTINALTQNMLVNLILFGTAIFSLKYLKKSFLYFSLTILLTPFLFFLTMKYAVWSYYWIGETPYFVLLISLLLGYLPKKYLVSVAIFVVFFFSGYFQDVSLHKNGFADEGTQTLSTEIAVADLIYNDAGQTPFSVYVLTPPVYDYIYRYIFWWKGNTVYHRYPNYEKQEIIYVIIDKNLSDPQGDYFIKNVVHTQTSPVKTWSLPEVQIKKLKIKPGEPPVDSNIFPPGLL